MVELSAHSITAGHGRLGVAGDTLNTAIYLARRAGPSVARVSYLTALGTDGLSDEMCDMIERDGIATDLIARLPNRLPGLYAIETDTAGERRFHYWRDASAARAMFGGGGLTLSDLDRFDVLYLSGITLAILPADTRDALIAHLAELRRRGKTIVFDSNYRPRLWGSAEVARTAMDAMWHASSIGLPSIDDEMALHAERDADTTLSRLAALGLDELVVKRGAAGPILRDGDKWRALELAAVPNVVDSTAAGDSFNAGYLAARLQGRPPGEACADGHDLAAQVVQHRGAILPRDQGASGQA